MFDPRMYNISVQFGDFEDEMCFEARIKELPDVAEYGDTFEEAYNLAIDTINTTAESLRDIGREITAPSVRESEFSGRITLRVPKSLHKGLAKKATDDGVSLNHLLVAILGAFRGFDSALEEDSKGWFDIANPTIAKSSSPKVTS